MDYQTQTDHFKYKDPGEVTGLYGWQNGGKTYIIAEVGLGHPEVDAISDSTTLYIDNMAVGNGTHVAKVVNADGAVSRVLFSYSSDSASGRPLYKRDHSLPFALKEYAEKHTDRLHGAMVACDGKLYAMSALMDHDHAQDMWSYDIASDTWALVELPKEYVHADLPTGCLATMKGKVYMIGNAKDSASGEPETALWQLDPSTGEWSRVRVSGLSAQGAICALGDNLFLLESYDYQAGEKSTASGGSSTYALAAQADDSGNNASGANDGQERSFFKLIDVDKGTITPVKGDIPGLPPDGAVEPAYNTALSRAVASDNKLYYYLHSNRQLIPGKLVRATYNADTQSMSVEDLTDAFNAAIGDKLDSYVDTASAETLVDHFTIAGLSDGLAIIGSDEIGADTHIIKDSGTTAETYGRTSCYHHATNPLAASWDGYLYVTANNATEPSVMYFRSTDYNHTKQQPSPSPGANTKPKASTTATPKTGDSLPATTLGAITVLALVSLATTLAALRRRTKLQK